MLFLMTTQRLASTQGQVDAIHLELMQRHEYEDGTDLTNVASVMLQLRETLPASYCAPQPNADTTAQVAPRVDAGHLGSIADKFMLTLSDVVLSKLSPEYWCRSHRALPLCRKGKEAGEKMTQKKKKTNESKRRKRQEEG